MNFFGIFEYSNLRRRKRRKLITDQHHIKDKELEELHILRLANHNYTLIVDYFPNFEKKFSMVKQTLIE